MSTLQSLRRNPDLKAAITITCDMQNVNIKISVKHRIAQNCNIILPGIWLGERQTQYYDCTTLTLYFPHEEKSIRGLQSEWSIIDYIRRTLIVDFSVNFDFNNPSKVSEEILRVIG